MATPTHEVSEPASGAQGPSGLTALIVYLRPAVRTQLLRSCADLGVFIVETLVESLDARLWPIVPHVDFVVVASDDHAAHVALVHRLTTTLNLPVLALISPGTDPAPYRTAGAFECVVDGSGARELADAICAIAAFARHAHRAFADQSVARTVFGDAEFRPNPPELRRGGLAAALSRTEREVLEVLCGSIGAPVPSEEIRRRAGSPGDALSDGNLKCMILRIRKKAESVGADRTLLRSVRGYGYVLRR